MSSNSPFASGVESVLPRQQRTELSVPFPLTLLGRASDEEVLMARLLEKALRRSEAVDREALCIVAGQKVSSTPLLGALSPS